MWLRDKETSMNELTIPVLEAQIEEAKKHLKNLEDQLNQYKDTYSIGEVFHISGSRYMLAQCGPDGRVLLVNCRYGSPWKWPVQVGDIHRITLEEMRNIAGPEFQREKEPENV